MVKEINTFFDKIYYINLDEATKRNEHCLRLLEELGITNFERIQAITKEHAGGHSSDACTMSHMKCFQNMIRNSYEKVLIFEDDFCLQEGVDYDTSMSECLEFLSENVWDVFFFDNNRTMKKLHKLEDMPARRIYRYKGEDKFQKIKGKTQAHSYAINKSIVMDVLNKMQEDKFARHNDQIMCDDFHDRNIYMYSSGLFDQLLGVKTYNRWKCYYD